MSWNIKNKKKTKTNKNRQTTYVLLDLMLSCSKGSVHFGISFLWLHTQSTIILFSLRFMPSFSFHGLFIVVFFFSFYSALFFLLILWSCSQKRDLSMLTVEKKIRTKSLQENNTFLAILWCRETQLWKKKCCDTESITVYTFSEMVNS